MLPDFLYGSYRRYKSDTDQLIQWLVESAITLGYEPKVEAEQPIPKKKGKKKKKTATTSAPRKHKISSRDFLIIAKTISESAIVVPPTVLQFAKRAAACRKRCAKWFMGQSEHEVNNQMHQYFISVIENVVGILEHGAEKSTSTEVPELSTKADINQLNNIFEHLELEDPTEVETSPAKSPTSTRPATYELNEESESTSNTFPEELFAAYLLFEDMHLMRDFLKQTWLEYKTGRTDLIAASITTNTAIDLIRQSTDDFLEKYPEYKENQVLQQLIYSLACMSRGEDFAAKERPGDPYNMAVADIAEWCYLPISILLGGFCETLEPNMAPIYKPGYFGTLDPGADHSKMSAREQFKENLIIVTEEMTNFAVLVQYGLFTRLPVLDEVTAGLVEMMSSKERPIWLCFGLQIYLDFFHETRTGGPNPFEELKATGTRVRRIISDYKAFSFDIPTPPGWTNVNEEIVDSIGSNIKEWLVDDNLGLAVWGLQPSGARQKFPLLSRHYILCGTFMFNINLRMQEIGIYISNAWVDTQCLAYLYNLLRQEFPGTQWSPNWPDMEQFIAIHGEEFLFIGGRPTTVENSLKKLMMSQGISATTFVQDKKAKKPTISRAGGRQLESTALMANMFRGRYCRRSALNFSAEMIEGVLGTIESKGQKESGLATTFIRKKWEKTHTLGPIQLLGALQIQLSNDEPKLLFNYFGMHQRSIEILRLIKIQEDTKLSQYFGGSYIKNETQIAALITLVHHVSNMSRLAGSTLVEETANKSRMLMSCGDVLGQYLKKNGNVASEELMEWCKRKDLLIGERQNQEEVSKEWVSWFAMEDLLGPAVIARLQTGIAMS
jgi:hypothetical protein